MYLYSYKRNPRAWKAQLCAKLGGVEIELVYIETIDMQTEEMLQRNPFGKLPVLETPEGTIFESNAIAKYICRVGKVDLLGETAYEQGIIDAFIDMSTNEIDIPLQVWLLPLFGVVTPNVPTIEMAKADIMRVMAVLDLHLNDKEFLCLHRLTLADIIVSMSLFRAYAAVFDKEVRDQFPHVTAWYERCFEQSCYVEVIGKPLLCEVALDHNDIHDNITVE